MTTLTRRLYERAGSLRGGSRQSHRDQRGGWRRALAHRRQRLLCHRGKSLKSKSSTFRTVIGDANTARRRKEGLAAPLRKALHRAACAVKSHSGKALLRKRGMHLERSFEHVLDEGGLRRATLQGTENLTKRHKIAAACFNLSLLMRTLLGVGTPKQWMAEVYKLLQALIAYLCGTPLRFRSLYARSQDYSSLFSLIPSESQPLHETTGFFNSLLGRRPLVRRVLHNASSSENDPGFHFWNRAAPFNQSASAYFLVPSAVLHRSLQALSG